MIPQRVRLKGFLCYQNEQEIDFTGSATLWMLSGLNGSGKSSIFDAVTYALFGYHRGGSLHATELINKESDGMSVEFDFRLDEKSYRARRTLKRNTRGGAAATQQLFRQEGTTWVAIDSTALRTGFAEWVQENVGLNYDTFTSSVLLLQGKAEKLLDSTPAGRREVLARIVDLGRYERLFAKADEKRKNLDGALKSLRGRLEALPDVLPLEIVEAKTRIDEAEKLRTTARELVERLQGAEHQARAWQDVCRQLTVAKDRVTKARRTLADAAAIDAAAERLRELREVIPRLHEIVVLRGQFHQSEEQAKQLSAQQAKQQDALIAKAAEVKQAHQRREQLHNQIARDEEAHRAVAAKLRATTVQLERLLDCERQEADLERLRADLAKLPADPSALAQAAREAVERLEALGRDIAVVGRFQARRGDLVRAQEKVRAGELDLTGVRGRGETLKGDVEKLRPALELAANEARTAADRATEARTLLAHAKESLRDVEQNDGAKRCRACGQELTAGHIEEERTRRAKAVQEHERKSLRANTDADAARRKEAEARSALEQAEKAYQEARDEYRDVMTQLKATRAQVEALQQDCASMYEEVPEALRRRIAPRPAADWAKTTYPEPADLDALRAEGRELEPAKRRLREQEAQANAHSRLKAQESTTLENLNRRLRDLPRDRDALRREHADLEAKEKSLFAAIDATRRQVKQAEQDAERLTRERDASQQALQQVETRLKEQSLTRQNAERNIEQQLRQLPTTWQTQGKTASMNQLHTLQSEKRSLEDDFTDDKARDLEIARNKVADMDADVKNLEGREREFPPEARDDPMQIAVKLREARRQDGEADGVLSKARERLAMLQSYAEQREELTQELTATDAEYQTQRLLAELLGKDRLQLHLVRQAERQVVEYANIVLDRLSGGNLYLKLAGAAEGEDSNAKALELEAYNRATGEKPINVTFLSGSQKFRVAVSLALGIGQYASKQHRPIESVIIDEGFGCLDDQGRQTMIQELQNLRGQMRCILLVSHQDDFAESFTDGYKFKLEGGATKVERFTR